MLAHIVGEDAVFAFADDIAICIRSVTQLAAVHRAFNAFSTATSLRLKPEKCVLLPLRVHGWGVDDQTAAYADLLKRTVPEWQNFQICGEAKYLGFVVGPRATLQSQWKAPVEKYETRVRTVDDDCPELVVQVPLDVLRAGAKLHCSATAAEPLCPPCGVGRVPADASLPS